MVSVIIPAYNAENSIEECITSVLNQTYREIEVIVVDDGSSDATFELCKKLANKDPRIVIISQINSGVSEARAKGVKKATGDYVYFLDADDTLKNDAINSIRNLVRNDIEIVISESNFDKICNYEEYKKNLLSSVSWPVWGKLFKRSLLSDFVLSVPRYFTVGEDFLFQLRLGIESKPRVRYVSRKSYCYNTLNPLSVQKTSKKGFEYEMAMVQEVTKTVTNDKNETDLPLLRFQLKWARGLICMKPSHDFNESIWDKIKESNFSKLNMIDRYTIYSLKHKYARIIICGESWLRKLIKRILKH